MFQRTEGIDISIRPTKLSSYYGLLYKEVETAIETLQSHLKEEDIYYEMEFSLYQTVAAGTMWKMEGKLRHIEKSIKMIK